MKKQNPTNKTHNLLTNTSHQFAFYYSRVPDLRHSKSILLTDTDLVHRITHIVRLRETESFTLFDSSSALECIIRKKESKGLSIEIVSSKKNKPLEPAITWLLPLLKRPAFEEALYSLSQLGAHTIQPIITKKASRHALSSAEYERAHKIMVSAAEQSKQFVLPQLYKPIALEQWKSPKESVSFFFEPLGIDVAAAIEQAAPFDHIVACAGPEGDIAPEEKKFLITHNFIPVSLTPSILKAEQAVFLGLGIIRSLIKKTDTSAT